MTISRRLQKVAPLLLVLLFLPVGYGGGAKIFAPVGPATVGSPLPSDASFDSLDRLLQRGQARRAVAGYARKVAGSPSEPRGVLGLVTAASRAGRLDWARDFLAGVRRKMPTAAVHLGLAEVEFQTARHAEGLPLAERAHDSLSDNADVAFARATALSALGNIPAAVLAVQGWSLDPLDLSAARTETYQRAATLATLVEPRRLGLRATQVAWGRAALEKDRASQARTLILAQAIRDLAEFGSTGRQTAERALRHAIGNGNLLVVAMGLIAVAETDGLASENRLAKVSAACVALAKMGDAVRANCLLSALDSAWNSGALGQAESLYNATPAVVSDNAILSVRLATASLPMLQATGRFREASEIARRAVDASEAIGRRELEGGFLVRLASSRRLLGDLPGAMRAASVALEVLPRSDTRARLRAAVLAAEVADAMGNGAEAFELLAEAEALQGIKSRFDSSGAMPVADEELTERRRRLQFVLALAANWESRGAEEPTGGSGPFEIANHALAARILENEGRDEAALEEYRLTLASLRKFRDSLSDPLAKTLLSDTWQALDRRAMSLAFEMGRWETALEFLEGARLWSAYGERNDDSHQDRFDIVAFSRRLPPDTAVVCFAVGPDNVWAVVLHQSGGRAIRLPADPVALRHLAALWRAVTTRGGDPDLWQSVGGRLSAALLEPLYAEGLLSDARLIYAVPDDALHSIPLHALPRDQSGGRSSTEVESWSRAPSLRALAQALERSPRAGPVVAFGPVGGGDTVREVYGATRDGGLALLGPRATKAAWQTYSSRASVLHFGGHALKTALDLSDGSILLRGGRAGGGPLTIREIIALDLDGATVVLLACDSATRPERTWARGFQPELPSLGDAFLIAGARAVVGNLWPITEQNARELAVEFYRAGGPARGVASLEVARKKLKERWPNNPERWAGAIWMGNAEPTDRIR